MAKEHWLLRGLILAFISAIATFFVQYYGELIMNNLGNLAKNFLITFSPLIIGVLVFLMYWVVVDYLAMRRFRVESWRFHKFLQKHFRIFLINSAQYGARGHTKDVAEILNSKIASNRIENFLVTNESLDALGSKDPARGTRKILTIKYSYCGESLTKDVVEGGTLSLPE